MPDTGARPVGRATALVAGMLLLLLAGCAQRAPSHEALAAAEGRLRDLSPSITGAHVVSMDLTPLASGELLVSVVTAEGVDAQGEAKLAREVARSIWEDTEAFQVLSQLDVAVWTGALYEMEDLGVDAIDDTTDVRDHPPLRLPEAWAALGLDLPADMLDAAGALRTDSDRRSWFGPCDLIVTFGPRHARGADPYDCGD